MHWEEHAAFWEPIAKRGLETRRQKYPDVYLPAEADKFWQSAAHRMVTLAIRRGILPSLDGSIACSDCGGVACVYDHRDYGKPLAVDPVCMSCNKIRGTATWPSADQFKFKRIEKAA